MERLTKNQREILNSAQNGFPNSISSIDIPPKAFNLSDIKILESKGLVKVDYTPESYNPARLTITPEGIEKLRETFITRLADTAYNKPWAIIAIIVSLILGASTVYYYSQNLTSQKLNFDLQNKIMQDNELKQTMPPTVWLTQEFRNGSHRELEIIPTLYFKRNSERLFTISNYEINVTLNGKDALISNDGYKTSFKNEGISEGKIVFISFYPAISEYNFFHTKNDLIIGYILEIKDMDSQYIYRGNVTTEIDSSIFPPKSFPSGREPLIFNWTKV